MPLIFVLNLFGTSCPFVCPFWLIELIEGHGDILDLCSINIITAIIFTRGWSSLHDFQDGKLVDFFDWLFRVCVLEREYLDLDKREPSLPSCSLKGLLWLSSGYTFPH